MSSTMPKSRSQFIYREFNSIKPKSRSLNFQTNRWKKTTNRWLKISNFLVEITKISILSKLRNLQKHTKLRSRIWIGSSAKRSIKQKRNFLPLRLQGKIYKFSYHWKRKDTKIRRKSLRSHMPSFRLYTRP